MTSLIFWAPYLAHKGIIEHRREKQRLKNYERWEGLRDDYDEQRKIARESRSMDIQRTGPWDPNQPDFSAQPQFQQEDTGIFTLRDQQEANDARTGWRPQESWDGPRTQLQGQMTGYGQQLQSQPQPQAQRHTSLTPAMTGQSTGLPLKSQKTGATWDEGLPAPLQVSRRSFDDYDPSQRYRSPSVSQPGSRRQSQSPSMATGLPPNVSNNVSRSHTPSGLREITPAQIPEPPRQYSPPHAQAPSVQEFRTNEFGFVEPVRQAPQAGGRMAELIERGY